MPNASRNDLEFSNLRTIFFEAFTEVADKLDEKGHEFQEWTKADEELGKITDELKKLNGAFYKSSSSTEKLVDLLVKVKNEFDKIDKRINRNAIRPGSEGNAKTIKAEAKEFLITIYFSIILVRSLMSNRSVTGMFFFSSISLVFRYCR